MNGVELTKNCNYCSYGLGSFNLSLMYFKTDYDFELKTFLNDNRMWNISYYSNPVYTIHVPPHLGLVVHESWLCITIFQPYATEIGIEKTHGSYLLALLGIANTLGRIILGFVSDKPWINRLMVYNLCLTICGAGECYRDPRLTRVE